MPVALVHVNQGIRGAPGPPLSVRVFTILGIDLPLMLQELGEALPLRTSNSSNDMPTVS